MFERLGTSDDLVKSDGRGGKKQPVWRECNDDMNEWYKDSFQEARKTTGQSMNNLIL
jgi:hypothetical protein